VADAVKVFISCDMEGISGVTARNHTNPGEAEYQRFRRLMTADVNAAIAGAFDAGASEVLVVDSHGPMTNILIEDLDPRAELTTGSNKHFCQMEGIASDYAAAFFIGYHAREGAPDGVINHTLLGNAVFRITCNGREVGETGINAGLAGHFGVPVALVSGDDVLAAEARELLGPIETAVTKQAIDRHTARCLAPARAQALIREAAARALHRVRAGEIRPYRVTAPVEFEVTFKTTDAAHMASIFPCVERRGPKVVAVRADDYPTAFRLLWGTLILGLKTTGGVL
jgi:D-amino peptidase